MPPRGRANGVDLMSELYIFAMKNEQMMIIMKPRCQIENKLHTEKGLLPANLSDLGRSDGNVQRNRVKTLVLSIVFCL